jgi:uncharacterized protein YkwD
VDSRLNAAAEHQAREVAKAGRLFHGEFASRMASYGVRRVAAENLGIGVPTVEEAIAQWKGSAQHNANLLIPDVTRIGFARAVSKGGTFSEYWALVLSS